jgi:hypothetical protein
VSYGNLQEMLINELIRKVGELTQRVEFGVTSRESKNVRSMASDLSMVGHSL